MTCYLETWFFTANYQGLYVEGGLLYNTCLTIYRKKCVFSDTAWPGKSVKKAQILIWCQLRETIRPLPTSNACPGR